MYATVLDSLGSREAGNSACAALHWTLHERMIAVVLCTQTHGRTTLCADFVVAFLNTKWTCTFPLTLDTCFNTQNHVVNTGYAFIVGPSLTKIAASAHLKFAWHAVKGRRLGNCRRTLLLFAKGFIYFAVPQRKQAVRAAKLWVLQSAHLHSKPHMSPKSILGLHPSNADLSKACQDQQEPTSSRQA